MGCALDVDSEGNDDDAASTVSGGVGERGRGLEDGSWDSTEGLLASNRRKAARAAASRGVVGRSPPWVAFAGPSVVGEKGVGGCGGCACTAAVGATVTAGGASWGGFWAALPNPRASTAHGCQTPPGPWNPGNCGTGCNG